MDAYSERQFRDFIGDNAPSGLKPLVIDLSKIDFIDSSGLGALVQLAKQWNEGKRRFLIVGNSRVVQTVKLVRLEAFLEPSARSVHCPRQHCCCLRAANQDPPSLLGWVMRSGSSISAVVWWPRRAPCKNCTSALWRWFGPKPKAMPWPSLSLLLEPEELDWVRRGRNACGRGPRRGDPSVYGRASGFETMVGWLYLNHPERLQQLFHHLDLG